MYRTLDTDLWDNKKFEGEPRDLILVAIFFMNHPQGHASGVFRFRKREICDRFDMKLTYVEKLMQLLETKRIVFFDHTENLCWVKNAYGRYGKNPSFAKSVAKHLAKFHPSPLVAMFLEYYQDHNIPYEHPIDRVFAGCEHPQYIYTSTSSVFVHEGESEGKISTRKKRRPEKPVASHDPEIIKVEIEKVELCLPQIREKFSTKNVNGVWETFADDCLTGGAKFTTPNPYNYTDFKKGFYRYLKNSRDINARASPTKGQHENVILE